jgi:hypothetical protein
LGELLLARVRRQGSTHDEAVRWQAIDQAGLVENTLFSRSFPLPRDRDLIGSGVMRRTFCTVEITASRYVLL